MSEQRLPADVSSLGDIQVLARSIVDRASGRAALSSNLRATVLAVVAATTVGWPLALLWLGSNFLLKAVRSRLARRLVDHGFRLSHALPFLAAHALLCLVIASLATVFWLHGGAFGPLLGCALLAWGLTRGALDGRGRAIGFVSMAVQGVLLAANPRLAQLASGQALPPFSYWLMCGLLMVGAVSWGKEIRRLDLRNEEALAAADRGRRAAESATAAKSAFIAMVSHELRTPLSGVLGAAADLESRSVVDPTVRERAAMIADSGRLMRSLLNDLLDLAKLEAGKMTVETIDFDLAALIETTIRFYEPEAVKRGLTLSLQTDHPLPTSVVGDPTRLRQILNNLLSNALKFTERGGVTVIVSREETHQHDLTYSFAVVDTGPGLSETRAARLFKPFDQTDSSVARTHGGTGLGLAISRDLARLMDGDLTVQSQEGEGSTFLLRIALWPSAHRSSEDEAPHAAEPCQLEGARVMVADDHAINRRVFELLLGPLGAQITFAVDGMEALSILQSSAFDLVITDVNMPRLSGLELAARLRAGGGLNRFVPIVAVSGSAEEQDVSRALAVGINGYVTKPIEPAALLVEIGRVLARPETVSLESAAAGE